MNNVFNIICFIMICNSALCYEAHSPILIENVKNDEKNPLIVEGYEISNPNGYGIQILNVDYVIIRNNYIHDCGIQISQKIQDKIKETGKTTLYAMDKPFETGGIMIFDAKRVELYNNKVINNDFGISVWGHNRRAEKVSIYNNAVKDNHRAFFIKVKNADNIQIYNNYVEDNGLDIFMDNIGLIEAFKRGENFPDGRSQGIATDGCNNVKIFDNTVINSNSDGIGAFATDVDFVENIEIFDNTILRNGEQGIWIVKARNGKIYGNKIIANRHRLGEYGGSSGIMLEGEVFNFDIYDNEIAYNDVFGISMAASSNISIYGNEIHHNGDGAFNWNETFYWRDDFYKEKVVNIKIVIRDNYIHHNRRAVFIVNADISGKIFVEDNIITKNGGNPIHYEYYKDYDIMAHPEDWKYDKKTEMMILKDKKQIECFIFGRNEIDDE